MAKTCGFLSTVRALGSDLSPENAAQVENPSDSHRFDFRGREAAQRE